MWVGDQFFYSKRLLKIIAENYCNIYEGLPLSSGVEVTNPWAIAEYKADFERALQSIGRGKWDGEVTEFKHYRNYGKLQRIVIADILGIRDIELEGFYSVPRLRGYAYYLMCLFLNNGAEGQKILQ